MAVTSLEGIVAPRGGKFIKKATKWYTTFCA